MSFMYLEPRHFKIKKAPRLKCPCPQYTEKCQGLYIHTRRWQTECVECMKVHKTLDRHPLLSHLLPKGDCDILKEEDIKTPLMSNNMAKGIHQTVTKTLNNKPSTQATHLVEMVVIDGRLVPDNKDINPGVFSR